MTTREIFALELLRPILPKNRFMPYSSSSLSFESMRLICNDIVLNNRQNILELGSGLSTLVIGRLLDGLQNRQLVSVDENEGWIDIMTSLIKDEDIQSVKLIHAPITESVKLPEKGWYNQACLDSLQPSFDCIIVDGPTAWQADRKESRAYAIEFLKKRELLARDSFVIYLDDCNRPGERQILSKWGEMLDLTARVLNENLGQLSKGEVLNIV